MPQNSDGKMASRRQLLKTTGIALASTGVTTGVVGASAERGIDLYDKSLELREKNNWSVEKWHKYLESVNGLEPHWKKTTVTYPKGPTTQELDRHESVFTYTFTDYSDRGYVAAEIHWDHKAGEVDDHGENPVDTAAIAYSSSHYDRTYDVDNWVDYGHDTEDPDGFDSKDPQTGAAAAFHDGRIPDKNDGYFGVRLEPNSNYDASQRELEFDYVHTWSDGGLSSVTIGTGGISFGFDQTTQRWDFEESFLESDLLNGETRDPGKTR